MELYRYLEVVRKWIWLIVLAVTLASGTSLIASLVAVPVYKTTTTVMIGQFTQAANPVASDFFTGQQLAQTYVQLVAREPILTATISSLGLDQDWQSLRGQVAATLVQGTQLLEVSVLDTSPQRAKAIADEIARQLILQSPTTPSADELDRLAFVQAQLPELEKKIKDAKDKIVELDRVAASATSAKQIQDAQQQQTILQAQINQWQSTYAQLTATLGKGSVNYVTIIEPAVIPRTPISPKISLNVMLAAAIGLTLSVAAAFLLEYLDDTIRSPEEVRALIGAPILTTIGKIEGEGYPSKLIAELDTRSPLTESYRALRTNLQFLALDAPLRTILVTSSGPGEGKSVTAANLAVIMARAGVPVILVDADLRRSVIHKIFGLENHTGLTSWLVGQKDVRALAGTRFWTDAAPSSSGPLESFVQTTRVPGLRVVTSGPLPPNPAEVLGSTRMRDFLEEATQLAEIVIVDSPPCVTVTDAAVLSRWTDGVLLVLDGQNTHRQAAKRAKENLDAVNAKVLGSVINRIDANAGGYYAYYSSYYYYGESAKPAKATNGKFWGNLAKLFSKTKFPSVKIPAANDKARSQ
ncbi:MAG: hypothetical protein HZB20_13050 [Chloroflexi bacterium]|nr:hypothetical protein [Chloroflexota bacterium]